MTDAYHIRRRASEQPTILDDLDATVAQERRKRPFMPMRPPSVSRPNPSITRGHCSPVRAGSLTRFSRHAARPSQTLISSGNPRAVVARGLHRACRIAPALAAPDHDAPRCYAHFKLGAAHSSNPASPRAVISGTLHLLRQGRQRLHRAYIGVFVGLVEH